MASSPSSHTLIVRTCIVKWQKLNLEKRADSVSPNNVKKLSAFFIWFLFLTLLFQYLFVFPFKTTLKIIWNVFVNSSFFIFWTLADRFFQPLAIFTLFSNSSIEIYIVAHLNLGQIAEFSLNCHLKVKTLFPQNLCSLVLCSTYFLHLIFKFAFLSWQVPRSSVGRALYRECGPSQDGDPDPGNLPFSVFVFVVFCRVFTFFFLILVHYITFFIFTLW